MLESCYSLKKHFLSNKKKKSMADFRFTTRPENWKQFAVGTGSSAIVGGAVGYIVGQPIDGAAVGALGYGSLVVGQEFMDVLGEVKQFVQHPIASLQQEGEHLKDVATGKDTWNAGENRFLWATKWGNPAAWPFNLAAEGLKQGWSWLG